MTAADLSAICSLPRFLLAALLVTYSTTAAGSRQDDSAESEALSLIAHTVAEDLQRAISPARKRGSETRPDLGVRHALWPDHVTDADALIAASQVVATLPVVADEDVSSRPAQQADPARPIEEIVVVAPRMVREREALRGTGVGRIITVEMTEAVDISDFDLTRTADVLRLEQDIRNVAFRICEELSELYPFGRPRRTEVCASRAIEDAMEEVDRIVRALAEE